MPDRVPTRPGNGDCLRRDYGLHSVRRWTADALPVLRLSLFVVASLFLDLSRCLPARPNSGVLKSLFRSARARLPHYSIADRGFDWWPDGRGPHGRERKAVLPARAAHRLYLFRAGRGTRIGRLPDRGTAVRDAALARDSNRSA